jgi:large subunit ribosomal protein L15
MPLQRRLPKRGFHNPFRREFCIVNVGELDARFEAGAVVDAAALQVRGLVHGARRRIKILGDGEVTKALTVKADKFSATAKQRLEAAGGTAEVVSRG